MFHRAPRKRSLISTVIAVITLAGALTSGLSARLSHAAGPGWGTFHDPLFGFSLRYPLTWRAVTDANGSHASFLDPQGTTVISPIVQTSPLTPANILTRVPVGATNVKRRMVAGATAVDFSLPYIPQTLPAGQQGGQAHERGRELIFGLRNTAGGSNVYMLLLTQTVDAVHPVQKPSPDADPDTIFTTMMTAFTPPASRAPAQIPGMTAPDAASTTSTTTTKGATAHAAMSANMAMTTSVCDMVCWANANWNFGNYWDTYTVPEGYFQPYFGCTAYVSRALSKSGLTPGLLEGGVYGDGGLSPDWSPMGYGEYPIRFGSSSSTARYDLVWTGTRGSQGPQPANIGLYEYLVDSGIGVPIGENLWEARPGDVLFLDRSDTPNPGYREHAMIITSIFYDGWTGHGSYPTHGYEALLDGHNAAAYHDRMSSWVEPYFGFPSFEIIHIRGQRHDVYSRPALTNPPAWNGGTDFATVPTLHTGTTNVWNSTTRWAIYRIASNQHCGIDLYIPARDATEHPVMVEVKTDDGRWWRSLLYENDAGSWDFLYREGQLYAPPVEVAMANADGTLSHYLGIGYYVYFYC
jgi:hypothetical protein